MVSSCGSEYNCCTNLEDRPQNRISCKYLAMASDRYSVSDGAAAAIASGVLKDHRISTAEENCYVIERSKLRRQHTKY